ncbi:hypothetical protein AB0J35_27645 [Nonomuraea angiospora]|uniref:hypothetical protein n=1 Tax=Nonomuraea angiospora TaxID=46172 RepID=UPI003439A321
MARHVLLYDGKCGRCSDLATKVVAISAQKLDAVNLSDPQAAVWASAAGRDLPHRPALVVLSDRSTRLHTGIRMVTALVRLLGVRRGAAVLRALGEEGAPGEAQISDGRRAFFRAGLLGLGVVAGATILPGVARAEPEPELTPKERAQLQGQAAAYDRLDVVEAQLRDNGFQTAPSDEVVLGTVNDAVVLSFYGRADGDPAKAAVLTRVLEGGRVVDASLELVSGEPNSLRADDGLDAQALEFSSLSLARPGEMETYGKKAYFNCMFWCVGANCRGAADQCRKIPILNLMLACIVAVCGTKAKNCHKVCKSKW